MVTALREVRATKEINLLAMFKDKMSGFALRAWFHILLWSSGFLLRSLGSIDVFDIATLWESRAGDEFFSALLVFSDDERLAAFWAKLASEFGVAWFFLNVMAGWVIGTGDEGSITALLGNKRRSAIWANADRLFGKRVAFGNLLACDFEFFDEWAIEAIHGIEFLEFAFLDFVELAFHLGSVVIGNDGWEAIFHDNSGQGSCFGWGKNTSFGGDITMGDKEFDGARIG